MSAQAAGRVALVGYGLGGAVFHAPFIAAEPRLELAYVVTASARRRQQAAARYPGVTVLSSFEALLDQIHDVDLVVLSTPNATHVTLAEAVLRRSRPVVLDKPVAPNAAQVRHLAEFAAAQGMVVVPFHNRRWDGDFQTVGSVLATGELGTLGAFESRYERWQPRVDQSSPTAPGSATLPRARPRASSMTSGPILSIRPSSSSDGPTRCTRRSRAVVPRPRSTTDAFIALRYANGPRVHLWASAVAADRGPRFRLLGSAGAYTKSGMDVQEAALIAGGSPGGPEWGREPRSSWGRIDTGAQGARGADVQWGLRVLLRRSRRVAARRRRSSCRYRGCRARGGDHRCRPPLRQHRCGDRSRVIVTVDRQPDGVRTDPTGQSSLPVFRSPTMAHGDVSPRHQSIDEGRATMSNRRKRMAVRYARRANVSGEEGVTISFGFSSLAIAVIAGVLEELPYVGFALAMLFFHFHRTVLVTDRHAYVFRDLPFHRPGRAPR